MSREDERTHEQGGQTDTRTGGTNGHTNRGEERTHEQGGRTDTQTGGTNNRNATLCI